MRILYVHATLVPPPTDLKTDRFYLLSDELEGDVLQPVWYRSPEEIEADFGPGSYPVYTSGRFRYHWFLAGRYHGFRKRGALLWFYLRKGLKVLRERRHDCIVAYSHMTTALCGVLLKALSGSKLVVEIATTPDLVYLTDRPRPTWRDRFMHVYSDICLHASLLLGDRAHLLYPGQLSNYPLLRKVRTTVFHEFVPVSAIGRRLDSRSHEPFVLFVGAPWYLKGVDLLIEAFRRMESGFPGMKLKILGHYPDRTTLDTLIGNSTNIEILAARPNPEVLQIIQQALVLALPSRCEGMGRVLIEAMAAGVPLIGSDVGGIPFMIQDGENGFVFPAGDSMALERRLRELLSDPDLRQRMGANGYVRAHEKLNEKVYVGQFKRMVEDTIRGTD